MPATPTRPQGRNGFSTLRTLFPYLWPPGRPGLKARVVIALFLSVRGQGRDRLRAGAVQARGRRVGQGAPGAVAVPLGLILAYGGRGCCR